MFQKKRLQIELLVIITHQEYGRLSILTNWKTRYKKNYGFKP